MAVQPSVRRSPVRGRPARGVWSEVAGEAAWVSGSSSEGRAPKAVSQLPFRAAAVNTAARTESVFLCVGRDGRGAIKMTKLMADYQVAQTAVGGFHRCDERQFLAAVGRCNRHLEASTLIAIGASHLPQLPRCGLCGRASPRRRVNQSGRA
jgi:hypothetical protein